MGGPLTSVQRASVPLRSRADAVGMGLSLLCMIHCLAFPVLVSFAPTLIKALPGDDATHRILTIAIGLAGALAFRNGYRLHRRISILFLFLSGMALVCTPAVLGEKTVSPFGGAGLTVAGSVLLVTAHWRNRSFCRSCAVPGCAEQHLAKMTTPDSLAAED